MEGCGRCRGGEGVREEQQSWARGGEGHFQRTRGARARRHTSRARDGGGDHGGGDRGGDGGDGGADGRGPASGGEGEGGGEGGASSSSAPSAPAAHAQMRRSGEGPREGPGATSPSDSATGVSAGVASGGRPALGTGTPWAGVRGLSCSVLGVVCSEHRVSSRAAMTAESYGVDLSVDSASPEGGPGARPGGGIGSLASPWPPAGRMARAGGGGARPSLAADS